MKVSVVIAAWNERENLEALTRRLHGTFASLPQHALDLCYVVAGDDGTLAIAERLRDELGCVRILQDQRRGLGAAYRIGFANVPDDADVVVTMDADLNHQPEEIPRLLETFEQSGADLVIGSRATNGSAVTGTPLWKRALSGVLNHIMHALFDGSIRDKTSGFRIYRASVVRELRYRQNDFSFQPEIVLQLQREGKRIVEAPIHFIHRRDGVSKMELVPTSLSYLSLLRGRFDRLSLIATLIVLAGIAMRLAVSYPVHKYPADSDAVLGGLCALDVLGGDVKIFYNGVRIGGLECYETAAVFSLFGVSRASLALVAPLLGGVMLMVAYRFFRRLTGRAIACVALLFLAFPSPAVMFWLYMPNSYPTTMLVCVGILWMTLRAEQSERRGGALALGVAIGVGIWTSFLTAMCTAPALLWLAWRRRDVLRVRWIALLMCGVVIGALPWIAFNVRYPLATFQKNFGTRPARGAQEVVSNLEHVLFTKMPELVASLDPEGQRVAPSIVQRVLRVPVFAITFLAFLALALREKRPRRVFWLVASLAIAAIVLNAISEAGATRELTVRYVFPMYFGLVVALGWFLIAVARRSRFAAVAIGAIVLTFNVAGYHLPGEPYRRAMEADARIDDLLVERMQRDGTQFVVGSFWRSYAFNFHTRENVIGVPCEPTSDFRKLLERVPDGPTRWIALTPPHRIETMHEWMTAAGVTGRMEVVGQYVVFWPDRPSALRPVLDVCGRMKV